MSMKNGKEIRNLGQSVLTARMLANKAVRSLPASTLLAINSLFSAGKITKVDGRYYFNSFTPPFPGLAFDRLVRNIRTLQLGKIVPLSTYIAVTNRCPFDCWHCSYSKRVNEKELTLDELKRVITELQDEGSSFIGLTGGEPLMRSDITEVIASIGERANGVLFTTGYELTVQKARELKEAGLLMPVISLDHYKKEIHDELRGYNGAFEIATDAIKIFNEIGLYVTVTFGPPREMVHDDEALATYINFVNDIGVNEIRVASPSLSGKLLGKDEVRFTEEELQRLRDLQTVYNKKKNLPTISAFPLYESILQFGCGAGFHHCFVDHSGNVCPCDVSPLSFGNIREESFSKIYRLMHRHFYLPGIKCYSLTTKEQVLDKFKGTLPLNKEESIKIVNQFPPRPDTDLPLFYQKLGFKNEKRETSI